MAYTTGSFVGAIMQRSFDSTTTPSIADVGSLITKADRHVDNSDLTGLNSTDKELLSSLMTAHLISVGEMVDFRISDVSINTTDNPTNWSKMYDRVANTLKKTMFTMSNE